MPVYSIRGVDVDFPFDAYDCQITYMDRVLESLQQGKNALLESPTGTGKTLCLLCSALAWRRSFGEFLRGGGGGGGGGSQQPPYGSQPSGSQHLGDTASQSSRYPVIIYASRTHSQLRQVIKELKATSYRPKMSVLGSREQMCIHNEVSKLRGRAQNNACHYLCKKRWCRHQNSVTEYMRSNSELGSKPFDIEDLVDIGRTKGPCPYYISREVSKSVDILFAPYNYLIDPGNRRSLTGIPWDNAVLIFDEAHNLESICADAASFDLLPNNLTSCIAEAQECIQLCSVKRSIENSADKQFDPENYAILKALLMALEKKIGELVIDSKELGYTKPGSYIYEFLSELNITSETSKKLIDTIDGASLLLEEGNSAETGPKMKAKATFHVNECQQTSGDALKVLGRRFFLLPSHASAIPAHSPPTPAAAMPVYSIRGVDVDFPFDAYDCQITYMDRVLESLQQGKNALLESPTGTGKTLCLLCSALAWRRSFGEFLRGGGGGGGGGSQQPPYGSQPSGSQHLGDTASQSSRYPVIIYASRTHSQLRQVIKELKATSYRPKMSVLGSREQMCIHNEVSKLRGRAQNNACHYLCKKRWCRHQNSVTEYMRSNSELGSKPFDIEDLVDIGRTKGPCPYYISREVSKSVDILFAPYNYLIDPGNRRSLTGIPWDNAVLIFDEAHNLESICADAASFDLLPNNLTSCIAEAQECIQLCSVKRSIENSADKQFDPENYAILKALLMALEKKIGELVIDSKELGYTKPGSYIYEFLSELNITSETSKKLIDTIDGASLLLEEGNSAETGPKMKAKATVCRLETIRDILDIIFRGGGQNHAKYYRFHVNECQQTSGDALKVLGKASRTLSWWCFNPGLAMEEFLKLGVRSIILTSGTLSPLDSLAMELNM
ncbi:hypothetical protein GUJ93_ZPchr0001g32890 [Zizania palustris]|uniref:Helicase ATP-binding domain-containing protein n=1 Tax=Zizania palustris TaxID=103762 RepID=A0A8J5RQZ9_ZIZPA|nr:hypothetical protein GUJ93_ZPchr0001g32890 [Zizania palustris]